MRNAKNLKSFVKYCENHPHQGFWQALVNWSGYNFIFGSFADSFDDYSKLQDTYENISN